MPIQRMPPVPWFDKSGSGVTVISGDTLTPQASFLISTQGQSQELLRLLRHVNP